MKLFGKDEEKDRTYVVGIPLSKLWSAQADAILDTFEPENPCLFVPRYFGIGWSLNLGAIAVKLGWIRPDDSLPDLAAHIPHSVRQVIALSHIAGGTALIASAVKVAQHESVPIKWSLTGVPTKYSRGTHVALMGLLIAGTFAAFPHLFNRWDAESHEAINLGYQADFLGLISILTAALVAADRAKAHPNQRQFLPVAAPILGLTFSGCIKLVSIKTALHHIEAELRSETGQD